MNEPIECPYCSTIIQKQPLPYNQTVQILCQNCGGTFDYVPGFGTLTDKGSSTKRSAIESDRPAEERATPPPYRDPIFADGQGRAPSPSYRDPVFADGRAAPDPRYQRKSTGKPFEPGKECARAFCITAALCGVCFVLLFLMMGFMMMMPFVSFYP